MGPRAKYAALLGAALTACQLNTRNFTPAAFPYDAVNDGPRTGNDVLYETTRPKLAELALNPAHRFLLETKPQNVQIRSVNIVVGGTYHPMTPVAGTHLWTYESPNQCTRQYSYYIDASYKPPLFAEQSQFIGSASSPLTADVTGFGFLVWYLKGITEASASNGTIGRFMPGAQQVRVVLQNLEAVRRRRVSGLVFIGTDAAKFQALNRPPMPVVMPCPNMIEFDVRWTPTGADDTDQAQLVIMSDSEISPGNWRPDNPRLTLTLQTGPSPP